MIRAVIVSLYGRVWERGGFWPGGLITSVGPVDLSSARSRTISVSTLETDRAPAALEKMKAPRGQRQMWSLSSQIAFCLVNFCVLFNAYGYFAFTYI